MSGLYHVHRWRTGKKEREIRTKEREEMNN